MFEIGFWEMILVAVVALIVFGPERLPGLVREAVMVMRKLQNLVSSAKQEVNRELELMELKQSLLEQKRLLDESLREPEQKPKSVEERSHEKFE